jgi:hypothetical protein
VRRAATFAGVSAVIAGAGTLAAPGVASATYCDNSKYNYAGQNLSTSNYDAILGWVTKAPVAVFPSNNLSDGHLANWLGITDFNQACAGQPYCWMQTGFQIGVDGNGHVETSQLPYVEYASIIAGYDWFNPPDGNATVINYKVLSDNTTGEGQWFFDTYEVLNGNVYDTGSSDLPVHYATLSATGEYYETLNACIEGNGDNTYPFFGANTSGTYTSASEIEAAGNGFGLQNWTRAEDSVDSGPYHHVYLDTSDPTKNYAFKTEGPAS